MNKFNRWIAATVATAAIVVAAPTAFAAEQAAIFTDVKADAYYATPVQTLQARQVLSGYADGTFLPGKPITRAEAVSMITKITGLATDEVKDPKYKDVDTDKWYYKSIAALAKAGMINGYEDGTFRPNGLITRGELAKILTGAFESIKANEDISIPFQDVKQDAWYKGYVAALFALNITSGKSSTIFAPNDTVTRGEAATFLYRSDQLKKADNTIQVVTDDFVTIQNKVYQIDPSVSGILNQENRAVLQGAKMTFAQRDDVITGITSLELTQSGKAADPEFSGNLVLDGKGQVLGGNMKIAADYITVQNLNVTGDLEISAQLEHDFYAQNLTVTGNTTVNGGDDNTVVFENTTLNKVNVNKQGVKIEPRGETTIKDLTITNDAVVTAHSNVRLSKVTITQNATTVELNVKIDNLVLNNMNKLVLTGLSEISSVKVGTDQEVVLDTTGKIGQLEKSSSDANIQLGEFVNMDPAQSRTENTPQAGSSGGGGTTTIPKQTEEVVPLATDITVSGVAFSGSGSQLTATIQPLTQVKLIEMDLNTDVKYEITEIVDQNGQNLLKMFGSTDTSGTLTKGSKKQIDLIKLFGLQQLDNGNDGISGKNLKLLVSDSFTVKIKLTNTNDVSKTRTYELKININ